MLSTNGMLDVVDDGRMKSIALAHKALWFGLKDAHT